KRHRPHRTRGDDRQGPGPPGRRGARRRGRGRRRRGRRGRRRGRRRRRRGGSGGRRRGILAGLIPLDFLGFQGRNALFAQLVVAVLGAILIWLAARWLRGMVQGAMARRRINPEVVRVVSRVTFGAV